MVNKSDKFNNIEDFIQEEVIRNQYHQWMIKSGMIIEFQI